MSWTLAPALRTLLAEVNALYPGRDKRTDGTISGYPGARSSHNYNSEGYVCALDITTGPYPGGISTAQGQALAEKVRLALKIQPRGIPAYPIHYMAPPYVPKPGPYIATAGTDWEWEPYGYPGSDPHTSHLHVSVDWDIYTGGAPSGLADYLTEMSWNLGSTTGQGSDIIPIQEDELTMANVDTILKWIDTVHKRVIADGEACMKAIADAKAGIKADLATIHRTIISDVGAQLAGIREAVSQTQSGKDIDWDAVEAAAKRGAEAAITEGVVKVAVTVEGQTPKEVTE